MEWKTEKKRIEETFITRRDGNEAVLKEARAVIEEKQKPQEEDKEREKLRGFLNTLKECFYCMDLEVSLILLAIACREHILFLGRTGVNKTGSMQRVIEELKKAGSSNLRFFITCLHPFIQLSEILGQYDIRKLMHANPQLVRIPRIQLAHFSVIDEIFNAILPLLNTFLPIMNERRCFDPNLAYHDEKADFVPLVSLMAASNERQPGKRKELAAIVDRFAVIHLVKDVLAPDLDGESRTVKAVIRRPPDAGLARRTSEFLLKAWAIEYETMIATMSREKALCEDKKPEACSLYPYLKEPQGKRSLMSILSKTYMSLFSDRVWRMISECTDATSIPWKIADFLQFCYAERIDISPRRVVKIAKLMLSRQALFPADSPGLGSDYSVCRYMGTTDEERLKLSQIVSALEGPR